MSGSFSWKCKLPIGHHWAERVLMVDLPESKTCNQAEYLAVIQVSIQQAILYVASLKTFLQKKKKKKA